MPTNTSSPPRRQRPQIPTEYAVVGNLTNGTHLLFRRGLTRRDAERSAARYRVLVTAYPSVPVLSVDVWAMRAAVLSRPQSAAFGGVE